MSRTVALDGLAQIFEKHARRPCLQLGDGATVTYAEFWRRSEAFARRLGEMGVKPGDRVLVALENSEHVLAVYLACAISGYVACPIDPSLPKRQMAVVRELLAPALVLDEQSLPSLLEAPASATASFGTGEPEEDFIIIHSSGSTGEPKGIVHSLRAMVDSATSFAKLAEMNEDTRVYHHFPMFYMAGIFNLFFCPLVAGSTIVVGERFSKAQMLRFWELPVRWNVNHLTLTPTMALSLCRLYRRDDSILDHVAQYQAFVSTGSPLYAAIAERFHATFRASLRSCYGVTEVGGTITFQSWEDALAHESVGQCAPVTQLRAGEEGAPREILVKTPFMAKGYLAKGGLERPYDGEGYFHTGDLGYIKDGILYFTGREHDLVKKGGEFVSTQLIENLALKSSLVSEVAAVGVPDEFWGAKVVLFYVPQPGAAEQEILLELERSFADALRDIERPDKVIPVPWMPKTSIGKIMKRELVEKYDIGRSQRT